MTVHVVGIGLDGAAGLTGEVRHLVLEATLLVGSDRHLDYFPHHPARRIVLNDFTPAIREIRRRIETGNTCSIVVLVSGDPLFFGLGRLLLLQLPPEELVFHPHLSSVQLAFNRIKVPWQDARFVSAHGRSFDELTQALQQGAGKIAVLTDDTRTPNAIARLLEVLDLSIYYDFWVCENLGGNEERVRCLSISEVLNQTFALLNVVVLLRRESLIDKDEDILPLPNLASLPMLGLPDGSFLSFSDRPGLITKREVRTLVLGELSLADKQTIWDIGAGTGSVSIEIARLFPTSRVYAIEKTAAGTALIEKNCQRFQVKNIISIHGSAPEILYRLPAPDRIFIGGSGGNLSKILSFCGGNLAPDGSIVLALATVEHLSEAVKWANDRNWNYHLLQVQLSRSVSVGQLTRFSPLNPVTILTAKRF
jgi:precorrin-6Y C5,15-methyltransferase (decarboxylating)